jgi:hypothetical protein
MLLTRDQVQYSCTVIRRKLGARNMAGAVAVAWRLCLIEADEIETKSLPPNPGRLKIDEAIHTYAQRYHLLPPPAESWLELRERCARIADDVRSRRARKTTDTIGTVVGTDA